MRALISIVALVLLFCSGCASYLTPGGPARLDDLDAASTADTSRQPSAPFPTSIMVVRVQAARYKSLSTDSFGAGRFSLLANSESPTQDQLKVISGWPSVAGVSLIDRQLLPAQLLSIDDLRLAAAKGQADILLLYTVATSFKMGEQDYAPLSSIRLDSVPDKSAAILSTVSAQFVDVKTGFSYGRAESSAKADDLAEVWSTASALDKKRLDNERHAVNLMLLDAAKTWSDIVKQYQ